MEANASRGLMRSTKTAGPLKTLRRRAAPLIGLIAALWIAHAVDRALGGALTGMFGLVPRRVDGLDGVIAMPLLHADWAHLAANTPPLLILGGLLLASAPRRFWRVTALVVILSGVLVWLLARPAAHIGASGLIFAWFGYLVMRGLVDRRWRSIAVAGVALALYGAPLLIGLSPMQSAVSWEGHLAGLVAGAAVAQLPRRG